MALNAFATESCRRAPPATTVKPRPWPAETGGAAASSGGSATIDWLTPGWRAERGDAALQNRDISELEQLLRHAGAKPEAGAAGSDDGSDVHVS